MHAERCPLCLGTGNKNGIVTFVLSQLTVPEIDDNGTTPICHGCGGRGWVEVADESFTDYEEIEGDKIRTLTSGGAPRLVKIERYDQ